VSEVYETAREVEFRDGKRWLPAYLADMMSGLETHRLTYEQAVAAANQKAFSDHVNAKADAFVAAHFRESH
jgi:hypothetical protein